MNEKLQNLKTRVTDLVQPMVERAKESFDKLERREKIIASSTAAIVTVVLVGMLLSWIFSSLSQYKSKFDDEVAISKQIELSLTDIAKSQLKLEEYEKWLTRRGANFSLTSYLERTAADKALTVASVSQPKVTEINNQISEVTVDLKLGTNVKLENLVSFMSEIENSNSLLKVSNLSIKPRFDNPQLLDVSMQVRTVDIKTE